MGVMKSHAEIQRAYRSRLKQQNPELLRMHDREKWRRQCLKRRSQRTLHNNTESGSTQSHNAALKYRDIRYYVNENISRHVASELCPFDVNENNDITDLNVEHSVKYPIYDLLRWIENVEVDDNVKYRFLKYMYSEKGTSIESSLNYNDGRAGANASFAQPNTVTSQRERNSTHDLQEWRSNVWTPDQVQHHCTNHESITKPIPIGSSSTSGVYDKLLHKRKRSENVGRPIIPIRRKSGNKRRYKSSKKITKNTPKNTYRKTTKQTTAKRNMTAKGRKHVKWDPISFDNADRDDDDDGDVDENGM